MTDRYNKVAEKRRIILWCVPRSCSTALAKCLSFVDPDTEVWMEAYLLCRDIRRLAKHELGVDLPLDYTGNEHLYDEVIGGNLKMHGLPINTIKNNRLISYEGVKHELETSEKSTVIVKEMCMACEGIYDYLPKGYKHVFIIRNPYPMFISFHKMLHSFAGDAVAGMDFEEIYGPFLPKLHFYGELFELWKHLQATGIDTNPLIIDTADLLAAPHVYLKKICEVMGAEYTDQLLTWDSSLDVIKEKWNNGWMEMYLSDKITSSLTFDKAFTSSGFVSTTTLTSIPDRSTIPADVLRMVDKTLDYYEKMYNHRYISQTS